MRGFIAARNVLKAWLLLIGITGLFALVGWELGGYRLLSIFGFCALLLVTGGYWYFDRVVLGMVGARELPVGEAPLLHSSLERLAAIAGVAKPRLYLIPDGLPRALATGRGPRSSAVAVSAGCVSACTPAELEGVLAHELAHVRHRDVAIQTAVVVLAASLVELSRGGRLAAAGAPVRARPASRPRASTCCCRRSGSSRRIARPPASAARRTGSPTP